MVVENVSLQISFLCTATGVISLAFRRTTADGTVADTLSCNCMVDHIGIHDKGPKRAQNNHKIDHCQYC